MKLFYRYSWLFLIVIGLQACRPAGNIDNQDSANQINEAQEKSQASLETLQKSPAKTKSIALFVDEQLSIINPLTNQIYAYSPPQDLILPLRNTIDSVLLVDSLEYSVWYSPQQGIVRVNNATLEWQSIYSPSEWFQANPFLLANNDDELVYFIDDQGTSFYSVNIGDGSVLKKEIPFPYGSFFLLSPNKNMVLFVAGYEPNALRPSYLIDSLDGSFSATRLETEAELADKELVAWHPRSDSILTIENSTQVVGYSINDPGGKTLFADLQEKTNRLTDIRQIDSYVYLQSQEGDWYVYQEDGNINATIPIEIVSTLNNPEIIPWKDNLILIRERLQEGDEVFKRLWSSDWRGAKKLLVSEYQRSRTVMAK